MTYTSNAPRQRARAPVTLMCMAIVAGRARAWRSIADGPANDPGHCTADSHGC